MTTEAAAAPPSTFIYMTNWKPYCPAEDLFPAIEKLLSNKEISPKSRYLALPFSAMKASAAKFQESGLQIGSSGMNSVLETSFTAPIATQLLKEAGSHFVLIGTSLERTCLKEDEASFSKKLAKALEATLPAFLCLGETSEEKNEGKSAQVITTQLQKGLEGLTQEQIAEITFIYEAPWIQSSGFKLESEELEKGYRQFHEIFNHHFGDLAPKLKIIFALPEELAENAPSYLKEMAAGIYSYHPIAYSEVVHKH